MWLLYVILALLFILGICFLIGFILWSKAIPTAPESTYKDVTPKNVDKSEVEFREYLKREEKKLIAMNLEEVNIKSFDGLNLHAYYKEAPIKTMKTIISVHGYKGSALYVSPAFSEWLIDYNYNILFIDLRSYGKSEGKYTCYGNLDSKDLLSWIDYLKERFNGEVDIALFGISMGGNTVSYLADKCPDEVKVIIDDCGYTSPLEEFKYIVKNDFHMPTFFVYFAEIINKLNLHFDFRNNSLDSLKASRVPVLLIHGTKDTFVPYSMGEQKYNACTSEKEFKSFENSTHARCYFDNKEEYQKIVLDFLVRHL